MGRRRNRRRWTDVQRLKDITPPMSHPMVDVAFNATNLYFAAQKKNWPLANYFLGETRNRMKWETALNPGPKGTDGNPVDMKSTFDGIDNGSLTQLKMAIAAKDSKAFDDSYKHCSRIAIPATRRRTVRTCGRRFRRRRRRRLLIPIRTRPGRSRSS